MSIATLTPGHLAVRPPAPADPGPSVITERIRPRELHVGDLFTAGGMSARVTHPQPHFVADGIVLVTWEVPGTAVSGVTRYDRDAKVTRLQRWYMRPAVAA